MNLSNEILHMYATIFVTVKKKSSLELTDNAVCRHTLHKALENYTRGRANRFKAVKIPIISRELIKIY